MSLVDFLLTRRQQRILAPLLLNPERSYSVNELIRIGGASSSGSQAVLRAIREVGLVLEERLGNQRRLRINTDFPIYPELRAICIKTFGIQEPIRAMLEPFVDQIDLAFIFGSIAKGTDRAHSDVDLIVVGSLDLFTVVNAADVFEQTYGRHLHLTCYTREDWEELRDDRSLRAIIAGPTMMLINTGALPLYDSEAT